MSKKIEKKRSSAKHLSKADQSEQYDDEFFKSVSATITVDDLYSQLQSLKHDIEIEVMQKKIKKFDRFFKNLGEDEALFIDMINWYKQNRQKGFE